MLDRNPLEGRLAVVTGAARGVGAGVARELARRGVRLALLGREGETLERVAGALETEAHCFEVDVTDDAAMERVAYEISARLGPASIVVANAGVAEGGPFGTSDPVSWRRVVEVNLVGSAVTARAFLPGLLATHGYFLQIASTASFGAAPMMSAYCASKAGVESFAQSLRAELAHRRVGVGIAYLSWVSTDMIRDADRYDVLRELRGHMPPRPAGSTRWSRSPGGWCAVSSAAHPRCTRRRGCGWRSPYALCCRRWSPGCPGGSCRAWRSGPGSRPPDCWARAGGPPARPTGGSDRGREPRSPAAGPASHPAPRGPPRRPAVPRRAPGPGWRDR